MKIICLIGPSGSGKTTIENKLVSLGYTKIVSYTTRKPRDNEIDGIDYNFVTKEQFRELLSNNILMECTKYNGNMYGAPKPVGSINYVIVVEKDGLRKIKEIYKDQAIGVYLDVPKEVLNARLDKRGDLSDEERKLRYDIDSVMHSNIDSSIDLVINGNQSVDNCVADILRFIKDKRQ